MAAYRRRARCSCYQTSPASFPATPRAFSRKFDLFFIAEQILLGRLPGGASAVKLWRPDVSNVSNFGRLAKDVSNHLDDRPAKVLGRVLLTIIIVVVAITALDLGCDIGVVFHGLAQGGLRFA
jgi:hypothetical protein